MTVRTDSQTPRAFTIAAVLVLPLIATGCATPLTHFEWGTQRGPVRVSASTTVRPASRTHYGANDDRMCDAPADAAAPVPQARPAWYQPQSRSARTERPSYPAGNGSFIWPAHGRVVSEFGARQGGERNDGINIEAPAGTPIYAAGNGTVSYSGNELRSYGNLLLVRHDNGFVTAYAHADHFVVAKDARVTRGQIIGYIGQSGDVRTPQLHFELRKGKRGEVPVDPRGYLGALQVAQR